MIPILNSEQIKAIDIYTIEHEPIASVDLMERAVDRLLSHFLYLENKKIHVICGTGNNGGDGLVLARKLWHSMVHCRVTIVDFGNKHSEDFSINLIRLQQKTEVNISIIHSPMKLKLEADEILADAIFGNGLKKVLTGDYLTLIQMINQSKAEIYSIDVPSGLLSENETPYDAFVHANKTLVLEIPRPSLFNPMNQIDFELVEIGLHKSFILQQSTNQFVISEEDVKIYPRNRFAFKNSFGHLLVVGGSKGMYGAPVISAKAAFKCGVGLVTCLVPEQGAQSVHSHLMEAMVLDCGMYYLEGSLPEITKYNAITIGMGIGQEKRTYEFLVELLRTAKTPFVIDADALNLLALHKGVKNIPLGSIITPHPGEFKRLVGEWGSESERLEKLRDLAATTESIVILKGTYTAIAVPDGRVLFNTTGSVSLATAGSGDLLSGMIGSFLAQGYTPLDAAMRGVYYHGKAGGHFQGVPVRAEEIINAIRF